MSDFANKENVDVTGKAGATIYEVASDPSAPGSAWLRGSVPNYNAESTYITSGVTGNYEKMLENAPTMSVVGGKVSPRSVAYKIIDDAYKDPTSPDCTGVTDSLGMHGVGKGTPPCTATVAFKKPLNMAGNYHISKIYVNITLDTDVCDDKTQMLLQSALAQAAGVGSADVVYPADVAAAAAAAAATAAAAAAAAASASASASGTGQGSGGLSAVGMASAPASLVQRTKRARAIHHAAHQTRSLAAKTMLGDSTHQASVRAARQARAAFRSGNEKKDMNSAVSKVQRQLAKLEREDLVPTTNLAAAEAVALKGDTLFERNLAAAALQLELSQNQLLSQAAAHKMQSPHTAAVTGKKESLITKDSQPFYWLHTPAADAKAAPAQLTQLRSHARHLLSEKCFYEAFIIVPTHDALAARVKVVNVVKCGHESCDALRHSVTHCSAIRCDTL